MTIARISLGCLFLLTGFAGSSPVLAENEDKGPRKDVETLSSEAFDGRGLGTEGLGRALDYLESRFEEVGLRPLGEDGYRQSFEGPEGSTLVNLVGVLGDAQGDRHVVLGAHYDHLGRGEKEDANHGLIHPGADDNASGIAVLLESAKRIGKEELGHRVVIVAFSGEEKGLLGSTYYVENPALPLESCTAMLNLDTVGRLFDGALTVFGGGSAQEFKHILQGVNYGFKFQLELPEKDPEAGDHVSFGRRGVPSIHVFTGPHADYHRPGDTAEKIDYEGLEKIAGFTTELAIYLAGRDEPLSYVPPGANKAASSGPPSRGVGRRVSFGSIPDFNYSGEGVLLSGVIPGSPAEKAGLEEGDKLVEFAGVAIEDLRAFSGILKGLNPGDEVSVVFERDGERHEATVTVVERK